MTPTPIFVLSLPRAGSTLLQRLLATHARIATSAEPWLLLPVLLPLVPGSTTGITCSQSLEKAIADTIQQLPRRQQDYFSACRAYANTIYGALSGDGTTHFLDKTPHYSLIVKFLGDVFPDASFVYLWRNPLACLASMLRTWRNDNWRLSYHRFDLEHGLRKLTESRRRNPQAIDCRYDDLIARPYDEINRILSSIGLEPSIPEGAFDSLVPIGGRLGDPTGQHQHRQVTRTASPPWPEAFRPVVRRRWARKYLSGLSDMDLATMGLDRQRLLEELHMPPVSFRTLGNDLIWALIDGSMSHLDIEHRRIRRCAAGGAYRSLTYH